MCLVLIRQRQKMLHLQQFTERLEQGEVRELTVKPVRQVYLVRGQFTDQAEGEYFETYVLKSEQTAELLVNAQSAAGGTI